MPANTPLFLARPDGATPLEERFESLTALAESRNGSEDARCLRARPHWAMTGQWVLYGDEDQALEPLRSGQSVLVPAWMHPVSNPGTYAARLDAMADAANGGNVQLLCFTPDGPIVEDTFVGGYGFCNAGPALLAATEAYPLVEARLEGDAFEVEQVTGAVRTVQMTLVSRTVKETDPYYPLPELQFPVPTDGTADMRDGAVSLKDRTTLRFEQADNGHLELRRLLNARRSVSGVFKALTRDDAMQLRSFLRRLNGRYQTFLWPCPRTGELKRWRLASDSISLSYASMRAVECSLTFTETTE